MAGMTGKAGIGGRLNRIFEKQSIAADIVGFAYSMAITVAPMVLLILDIALMERALDFSSVAYLTRELFSCTILYTFIFALLTAAPFNAILSKYMQDAIYEERYQDILPCFYIGLLLNLILSCGIGIPFCVREHFVGGVDVFYVFTGFCAYISLVLVFYAMLYLSICKDYQRISIYFLLGMAVTFLLSLVLRYLAHWSVTYSMLFSLTVGFLLTAALEFATIKRYFRANSNRYKPVLRYFKDYWQLVVTNFLYILGLYVHNFVFWTTDMRIVVADSFVCYQPYDMATCLAVFTNISAVVIFVSRVEMHFHGKYRAYSEAVIGGKGMDVENAKVRMFRQVSSELMTLVRIQFIISVVVYLICIVALPRLGFAGMVMRIYPCLSAGYFILFLMYAVLLFLYYFNDLTGAVLTTLAFVAVTVAGSLFATQLSESWYGIGLVVGSFVGWTIAYMRIRWMERHLTTQTFCQGALLKRKRQAVPPSKVYERQTQGKTGREPMEKGLA